MSYFEVALIPVPEDGKDKYLAHAQEAAPLFKKHGALRVTETWAENVPEGKNTSMHLAVQRKEGETLVCSIIEWPDKQTRDGAMDKVMQEMRDTMTTAMPFDGSRLIYGGFQPILDQ